MNTYKILIRFKDGKNLEINANSEVEPREKFMDAFSNNAKILFIGDYFIKTEDVLWIKIEGETIGKPVGQKLPHIREEKQ